MKKILIVTTVEATVRSFLIPHIKHLERKGLTVEIATSLEENTLTEHLPNVTIHHIPFSRNVFSPNNAIAYIKMKQLIKNEKYQLIHVHTPIASFLTRLANRTKKIPLVYTAHGFHFNEQGSKIINFIYRQLEKIAGKWLNKLIVINKEDFVQAHKIVPKEKICFIAGIGIDEAKYDRSTEITTTHAKSNRETKEIVKGKKVLIHIAEFNSNKRQIDIIHAARHLREKREDFIFFLVGDGPLREEMEKLIQDLELEQHVRVLGYRTDIIELLRSSHIGLNVSLREGLPRSVMEMMALQLPVIATNIRGNRDLVEENKTGFLVPVKDPLHLAKRCEQLLENGNKCSIFGKNGRKKIEGKYSLTNVLHEIDHVYKEFGL